MGVFGHFLNTKQKNLFDIFLFQIYPYWQILENSSRNFSFPGRDTDRFLENAPRIFRNFNFRGMNWTDFWKTRPYLGEFSRNRSMSRPKFFEYHSSTECSILDEFSRNRSSSCLENLPIRVKSTCFKLVRS